MKIDNPNELLYRPFDLQMHADNFKNYCEVIICEDGSIEYAVPSHQERLIMHYANKHHISRNKVIELFYNDVDAIEKMMVDTKIVFVWYEHLCNFTKMNAEQLHALNLLIIYGCVSDACLNDIQDFDGFESSIEYRENMSKKLNNLK